MKKSFSIGIFDSPDRPLALRDVLELAKRESNLAKTGRLPWIKKGQSPLEDYGKVVNETGTLELVEDRLVNYIRANQRNKSGSPVKVLDVTFGTGTQWLEFLKKHGFELGRDVEIHGSALTTRAVVEKFKPFVKACLASKLYKKFKPNHYDFVVSNLGPYCESKANIENAVHLAKPGREVMLDVIGVNVPNHAAITNLTNPKDQMAVLHLKKLIAT